MTAYDDAYEALAEVRKHGQAHLGAVLYAEHLVPRLHEVVKMTLVRTSGNITGVEPEFTVDWTLVDEIIANAKPLDDVTVVKILNTLNVEIRNQRGNTPDFLRGMEYARDIISRMRATK